MSHVMPKLLVPLSKVEFSYARSSGPGGQNVNKVASKAILRWNLLESTEIPDDAKKRFAARYPSYLTEGGDVILMSQKHRDAPKNRADCLEKLQKMLEIAMKRPKKRIPTQPTRASVERRLDAKSRASEKKTGRRSIPPQE